MLSITKVSIGVLAATALIAGGYYGFQKFRDPPPPACSGSTPIFIPTNGGELLLGTVTRTQTFSTKHVLTVMGAPVPACDKTSSITIPTSTSYTAKLEKRWEVRIRESDRELIVIAPDIKPLLPVAFDTAGIRKAASGCFLLDKSETLDSLEREISKQLEKHALSAENLQLARASGRMVAEKFVRNWLVKSKEYEHAAGYSIKVFFQGDPISYY